MTFKKTHVRLASSVIAGLMLLWQIAVPVTAGATNRPHGGNDNDPKVKICHATSSYTNPYQDIEVDQDATDGDAANDNGQGDHYLEHQGPVFYPSIPAHTDWGDIIPPVPGVHSGLNWTAEGQAMWNNDCAQPMGKIQVDKKVDKSGNGNYEDGNSMNFAWGVDNEDPTRPMGSKVEVSVGQHTVSEKSINGYVFTGWYYTDDWGKSCQKPEGTALPVQVSVKNDKTKKITLCNKVQKGSITIIKDAQPNSDQYFHFEIDKQYSQWDQDFALKDDGHDPYQKESQKEFKDLTAGRYTVDEKDANDNGWTLSDISCSEGADVHYYKEHAKVVIDLHAGDSVTCTFVNQKKGKITVYKHTVPAHDKTKFAIRATGDGTIYSDSSRWIADGESEEFYVSPGTYTVTEKLPAGWMQTKNTCEEVVVSADNLYPSCHLTNTKLAKLKIKKDARPAYGEDFTFTSEELGTFTLDNDDDPTYSNQQQFSDLEPGKYTITEQAVNEWDLKNVSCWGAHHYNVELDQGKLTVKLKAGDDVTCKFVNEKRGSVDGFKFEDMNGNGEWDDEESGLEAWTITIRKACDDQQEFRQDCDSSVFATTKTDEDGAYRFANLEDGTYIVCEEQQDDWIQTYPQTEDGCHTVTVECPGAEVHADFGNFRKGKVQGVKFNDVNGNHEQDEDEPTLAGWTVSLYAQTNNGDLLEWLGTPTQTTTTDEDGAYSFDNLLPGTYKVCETQKNGWTRTFPEDSDCHEFTIEESGQVVVADFGNKPEPQVLDEATLVNTGASMSKQLLVGLTILSVLAAVHFLSVRRKDYAR